MTLVVWVMPHLSQECMVGPVLRQPAYDRAVFAYDYESDGRVRVGRGPLLVECTDFLSDGNLFTISEFVDVGEFDLAFDTLCTQLYEYEFVLSEETVDRLAVIGTGLGHDP